MEQYKIGFVLDDSLDKTDGVQQYVLTVGRWLASKGHNVHYIVGQTKRQDIPNIHSIGKNVNVRFNGNRMSIPLPVPKRVVKDLMTKEEFDILHVQMPYSPWLAGRVIRGAIPQTAIVGTFHIAARSKLVLFANMLLRIWVRRSLRCFDEIASVSNVAQDFAWETFRVESSVIPNTLPLSPFYQARPPKEYDKTTNIVFFGRLVERKGCRYFLRAIDKLYRNKSLSEHTRVIVCGTGPLERSLKTYVKHRGLTKLVTFTGFVSEEEKPNYLAAADVAVYPSLGGESFGIVLLEAMAAARGAVLAGNNPGYAAVIGERPQALFDPRDVNQLAQKIQVYLDDPLLRDRAQSWQREFVRKFDVQSVTDEILALYAQALHKRRG